MTTSMNRNVLVGNSHSDSRGIVRFINAFNFECIKRFYTIKHPNTRIIRAWQGHQRETKYFFIVKGSFLVCWVRIDIWENPSKDLKVYSKILTDKESEILIIHPGNANGFRALAPDSILLCFSDMTLEESKNDDYRYPVDYWDLNQV